ncbi:hypothetical protein KOI35_00915 [Actinoplanes bogorensis]|uniref:Immunity protein 51 of polymorphic toxin system n=1 Tax=Paractinoplanes bogorensis TaxID=1610840 RepID=A0ABS5YH64_9ACTN|nr:hypothetical protein [Actinoplanes bogorensis]MBU2662058.1 hypothetical protein [Actinoplanes bogorensis]
MGSSDAIRVPGAEIDFVLGAADDPETVDDFDVVVTLDDGTRWSAGLLTMGAIQRIMDRWATTGEAEGGDFFQSDDLMILRRPGVPFATDLLRRLAAAGQIQYTLRQLHDDD